MIKAIVLIGGGGHCASCIEVIESSGLWEIAGIIDTPERIGERILGYEIIGSDADIPAFAGRYKNALITVGQIKTATVRVRLFKAVITAGFSYPQIIAGSAIVSRSASLGRGTIVMHRAFINAAAKVGDNCIINTGAVVEHDAIVGNNTHVSTGAIVNGGCHVGNECLVGSGSVIRNGIHVADDVVIGAGAVVIADIAEPGVYAGCPARKIG
ncbi:MAG: acetyltransferase, partial [Chlorobium sp.]|nr:acetyltransferase [Chlorobium sp.]